MRERPRETGPDEDGPALEDAGVLAIIEGECFEIRILVARSGRVGLCVDRPVLPLPREAAAALLEALAAARLWASGGVEGEAPIDVGKRVESVDLPPQPVDPLLLLGEAESFGVFTTAKGPDALIGLVLRELGTPLAPATIESMIATLTSAWLWLWGRGGGD